MRTRLEYSTLVFDLDGTLSDSRDGISRSINFALSSTGHPELPESDIHGHIGPPLDAMFLELVPFATEADVAQLVGAFRKRYARIGYAENRLYDGIETIIQTLHGRGQPLGVCTGKRVDFAKRILAMFSLGDCFPFVDGGDVGRDKRDQLAELLTRGVIDADALMIGDRRHDIEAARHNGLRAAAVSWGYGTLEELEAAQPDLLLHDPSELLELR